MNLRRSIFVGVGAGVVLVAALGQWRVLRDRGAPAPPALSPIDASVLSRSAGPATSTAAPDFARVAEPKGGFVHGSDLHRDPFFAPEEDARLHGGAARTVAHAAPRPQRPRPPRPLPAQSPTDRRLQLLIVAVQEDGRKVALLDGEPLLEGDKVGQDRVLHIDVDHVELVSPSGEHRTIRFGSDGAANVWTSEPGPQASTPAREGKNP